jgi:acyl carrier protein
MDHLQDGALVSADLERVSTLICTVGKIAPIDPDADFYEAGFSSVSALQLLMELEDAFGVSIPDDQFITARTPRALHEIVVGLQQGAR